MEGVYTLLTGVRCVIRRDLNRVKACLQNFYPYCINKNIFIR